MIILDATTKSLEVVLGGAPGTTQLVYTSDFADVDTNNYTPGSSDGITNSGTAVTVVAAPAASTQRQVKLLTVHNQDTAAAIVTVQVNNASTIRKIATVTLAVGSTLVYTDGEGFRVITTGGAILGVGATGATGATGTAGPTGPTGPPVSLPITAAANDVVLQDSTLQQLISLDAAERLTIAYFNLGSGPFSTNGTLRGDSNFNFWIRNSNDDDDLKIIEMDSDQILFGSGSVPRINFRAGDSSLDINGNDGILGLSVTDGSGTSTLLLEGTANANAFYASEGTPDLGTAALPWKDGYFSGFLSTVEMTAPSAPAANGVRVYAQDNGAGKTQLMALFSSGAAQQIAIQP